MEAALLFAALLAVVGPTPAHACLVRRASAIIAAAEDAEDDYGTPPGVLLAVGFLETHLGCDRGSGRGWGAPRPGPDRHIAGTPSDAARVLTRGRIACGSWARAITRFRSGQCGFARRLVGYEPSDAVRLIGRTYERAGIDVPTDLSTRAARR